jgi:integral membrane protein
MAPLRRFRLFAMLEGISLILLVFGGVPLKHLAANPLGVRILGPIHGLFFLLYAWAVYDAVGNDRWTKKQALWAMIASVLPFGTFVLDARIRRDESRWT